MSDLVERLRALQKGERVFSMSYKSACKEAADEITRLDGLREQAEFVIDTLESNARVQAKLLADTGRERDELKDILKKVTNALNEEYYDHFELKDLAEKLRSLLEVKD